MNLFALSLMQQAAGGIALAALLGVVGFFLLLPNPRGRFIPGGIAALIASAAVFVSWLVIAFGEPVPDLIGTILFWFFSSGALIFGTVLVVQKNPARGAIAFAFVVLSTCGLFLLLAAPFLMAATIIIYAGAIIVTFLFVLMLSHAEGPSDENDRSREPLYGGFAGFAFVGLILFTLYQTSVGEKPADERTSVPQSHLLLPVITPEERKTLTDIATRLEAAEKALDGDVSTPDARFDRLETFEKLFPSIKNDLTLVVGGAYAPDGFANFAQVEEAGTNRNGSIHTRLVKLPGRPDGEGASMFREDEQARAVFRRSAAVRKTNATTYNAVRRAMGEGDRHPDRDAAKALVRQLRDDVLLLRGAGDLPASNVRNLGFVLYSEHLLAIELAGTLLLVAVIGAIAIAHRKGVAK